LSTSASFTSTISPSSGRDDIGGGLDAFDDDDLVALGDLRLDLGQFDEHHVAQLRRGVVRDAHDDHVAAIGIGVEPFMIFRELHVSLSECLVSWPSAMIAMRHERAVSSR
jgi:hypothetical protein